jgi:hypothetical protein
VTPMTPVIPAVAASLGLFILVGCVSGGAGNANKYATACMAEVNPVGGMVWRDGDDRVLGDNFATLEGIEAMNACIDRKAVEAGGYSSVPPTSQVTTAQAAGGTVTETFTYGQPPAPATTESCPRREVFSGGSGYFGCY